MRYVILTADPQSCCITAVFESNGDWSISRIHEPRDNDGNLLDMTSADALNQYVREYSERYYPETPTDADAVITDESFVWTQVDELRISQKNLGDQERDLRNQALAAQGVVDMLLSRLSDAEDALRSATKEMHILCRTPWWTQWWWWLCGWPENRIVTRPTPRLWHKAWRLITRKKL